MKRTYNKVQKHINHCLKKLPYLAYRNIHIGYIMSTEKRGKKMELGRYTQWASNESLMLLLKFRYVKQI